MPSGPSRELPDLPVVEALDDVRAGMRKLLAPTYIEKELGKAQVRMVFTIPKAGAIAGSMVTDGKILRSGKARLLRGGEVLFRGDVASLRRHKDDVKEVGTGFECGIGLAGFNEMEEGDIIEAYELVQVEGDERLVLDDQHVRRELHGNLAACGFEQCRNLRLRLPQDLRNLRKAEVFDCGQQECLTR